MRERAGAGAAGVAKLVASSVCVRRQELGNDFVCSVDVTRINIAHVCHAHNAPQSPPFPHLLLLIPPLMHRGAVAYYRNCICHKTAAPTSWPALPCLRSSLPSCYLLHPFGKSRLLVEFTDSVLNIFWTVYTLSLLVLLLLLLLLLRLLRGLLRRKVFATNLLR